LAGGNGLSLKAVVARSAALFTREQRAGACKDAVGRVGGVVDAGCRGRQAGRQALRQADS
jgi:hypothetical protein